MTPLLAAVLLLATPAPADPLAAQVDRWSTLVQTAPWTDDAWKQVKEATAPALDQARAALADGRRLYALLRLGPIGTNLGAAEYVHSASEARRQDPAFFEAEWTRLGRELAPPDLKGLRPAAVRAIAEAAAPQARVFHEASLEYGRNTMPSVGLFYLGSARAQRNYLDLCRALAGPTALEAPPVRDVTPDLDVLEAEVLAAYRPPASIDRHTEFITVNVAIKEARELGDAGLRHGALLRYLQAALRFAPLRPAPPDVPDVPATLRGFEERMAESSHDHSLGQLLLEIARTDEASARAVAGDVLPRYLAALAPPPPAAKAPKPGVTVTLVRWPYT